MGQSILTSIKKLLMIAEDYNHYDLDIILHINSVFSVLYQLGVGPQDKQFRISDDTATWEDFIEDEEAIEMVKTYMGLKLKLIFDPPDTGFVTNAYQDMIKEYEWRLNVAVDPKNQEKNVYKEIDILQILYEKAVKDGGFVGTKEEWLNIFYGHGSAGFDIEDISKETIDEIIGTATGAFDDVDILDILYNKAVESGYTGTKTEWIDRFNASGVSGDAKLKAALIAKIGAGGIKVGDSFNEGEALETLWRRLLDPVTGPKITEPSVVLTPSGGTLLEKGEERGVTLIIKPHRGTINPPNGTSGYRAGDILQYKINGEDVAGDIYNAIVNETNALFTASVEFGPGEQPKDSAGNDYGEPYAGGVVNSGPVKYEFVEALWSNANDILNITKEPLISKSAKSKIFEFAPQTKTHPETFDVPASWNVTAVEVFNEITERYEDDAREFDISTTTHLDAAGNEIEYKRYTDNRGYAADSRKIKITWA